MEKIFLREEYIKPDTTAQIYWLNNRQPKYWRNKPESTDREENTLDNLVNAINNIAEMGEEREK